MEQTLLAFMGMKRRIAHGFTLVELLVVVAIVGIMGSLSVPLLSEQVQKSRRSEAIAVLNLIDKSQNLYAQDHNAYAASMEELLTYLSLPGSKLVGTNQLRTGVYTVTLAQPWGLKSWQATATGQLDNDAWPDVVVGEVGSP